MRRFAPCLAAALAACSFDPAVPAPIDDPDASVVADRDAGVDDGGSNGRDAGPTRDAGPPACGNGALDDGETCDDGNLLAMDGCSTACAIESGWYCVPGVAPSSCERAPTVDVADTTAIEGSVALVAATLTATVGFDVVLTWATRDGTAVAPGDYEPLTNQTLTIAAGASGAQLPVTVEEDPPDEGESFTVVVEGAEGALLGDVEGVVAIEERRDLVERGLVVRYFLDEADGERPGTVFDSGRSPAFDLQLFATMAGPFFEDSEQGRVLRWNDEGEGGSYARQVTPKIINAFTDTETLTMEAVVTVQADANASRVFDIGTGFHSECALAVRTDAVYLVRNDNLDVFWSVDLNRKTPAVVTAVFDQTAPDAADRLRLYVDGVDQGPASLMPQPGETFRILAGDTFLIGNAPTNDKSLDGRIGYVAVYNAAFTEAEALQNAQILSQKNDAPTPN
ncbi:MAG: LamG-like jellyroll fold domain-containing protein [Deltaproteobacteria bacterium]